MSFTGCCNLRFIGDNHSPIQPDGYCLHCGFHPEIENLKKENEELKDQLKWALNCIDMNLGETDWSKAFRLMAIYGVSHQQVCWDHPELIEEAARIKGEAK